MHGSSEEESTESLQHVPSVRDGNLGKRDDATLKTVVASACAAAAVIPGLSLLTKGLWAPPGLEGVFGQVVSACGVLTVLLLGLFQDDIGRLSRRRVVTTTTLICVVVLLCIATFSYLRAWCVHPFREIHSVSAGRSAPVIDSGMVYFPLWLPPDLQREVDRQGGRREAADQDPAAIELRIGELPGFMLITNTSFAVLYITIDVAVIIAFGIAGLGARKHRTVL